MAAYCALKTPTSPLMTVLTFYPACSDFFVNSYAGLLSISRSATDLDLPSDLGLGIFRGGVLVKTLTSAFINSIPKDGVFVSLDFEKFANDVFRLINNTCGLVDCINIPDGQAEIHLVIRRSNGNIVYLSKSFDFTVQLQEIDFEYAWYQGDQIIAYRFTAQLGFTAGSVSFDEIWQKAGIFAAGTTFTKRSLSGSIASGETDFVVNALSWAFEMLSEPYFEYWPSWYSGKILLACNFADLPPCNDDTYSGPPLDNDTWGGGASWPEPETPEAVIQPSPYLIGPQGPQGETGP
ncbi:MAG: hypothetical protein ACD_39C00758G0001, partial [uncultured bacterium]